MAVLLQYSGQHTVIKMNANDHDDIVILKEQMRTAVSQNDELIDKLASLTEDLRTFKSLITTGKWVFATILFTLGVIGHKSLSWLSQFVWGN